MQSMKRLSQFFRYVRLALSLMLAICFSTGVFGDSWLTLRRLLRSLGTVKLTFLRRIDDIYYMLHTLVEAHLAAFQVIALRFNVRARNPLWNGQIVGYFV